MIVRKSSPIEGHALIVGASAGSAAGEGDMEFKKRLSQNQSSQRQRLPEVSCSRVSVVCGFYPCSSVANFLVPIFENLDDRCRHSRGVSGVGGQEKRERHAPLQVGLRFGSRVLPRAPHSVHGSRPASFRWEPFRHGRRRRCPPFPSSSRSSALIPPSPLRRTRAQGPQLR
jgi:hypothetical protein